MEMDFVMLCTLLVTNVTPASAAAQVRAAFHSNELSLLITVMKRELKKLAPWFCC